MSRSPKAPPVTTGSRRLVRTARAEPRPPEAVRPETRQLSRLAFACARGLVVCAFVALAAWPRMARAQNDSALVWREDWDRVGLPEYILTPSFIGGAALVRYVLPPPKEAFWTRPLLFDAHVRGLLRAETKSGRQTAATVSDVALLLSFAQPMMIDTVVIAGLTRDGWDPAWQMEVIGAQSYSLTMLLNSFGKRVFARQRPYAVACADDEDYSDSCATHDRFRSFYSGHAAFTATGAGLVCAHHTHVPVYGSDWLDTGACLAALGATLTTGTLRIVADRHWATDVITGHLIGFTTGYLIPTIIYYRSFRARPVEEAPEGQTASTPVMLRYSGEF